MRVFSAAMYIRDRAEISIFETERQKVRARCHWGGEKSCDEEDRHACRKLSSWSCVGNVVPAVSASGPPLTHCHLFGLCIHDYIAFLRRLGRLTRPRTIEHQLAHSPDGKAWAGAIARNHALAIVRSILSIYCGHHSPLAAREPSASLRASRGRAIFASSDRVSPSHDKCHQPRRAHI